MGTGPLPAGMTERRLLRFQFRGRWTGYVVTVFFDNLSVVAGPVNAGIPDSFQVRYASNLNIGDSVVNITNTGASTTTSGQLGFSGGNLCVNAYVFDQSEELLACCSCFVTPNGLQSMSVKNSLIANNLTPEIPNSVAIKLLATNGPASSTGAGGGVSGCNPGAVNVGNLASGKRAWGTTLHALPGTPAAYGITETTSRCRFESRRNESLYSVCAFIRATDGFFSRGRAGDLGRDRYKSLARTESPAKPPRIDFSEKLPKSLIAFHTGPERMARQHFDV